MSSASISPSNSASQHDTDPPSTAAPPPTTTNTLPPTNPSSRPKHQPPDLELGPEKAPQLIDVPLPWRPSHLRRRVLLPFAGAFAGLVVALEALADYSRRSGGFGFGAGAYGGFRYYLWVSAAPALLALLGALWARVDYQARAAAPWVRLSGGRPEAAERTLLVDYVSMARARAVVRAVANGDGVVACAAGVSLVLGALAVLSTALLAVGGGGMGVVAVPVSLGTAFVDGAEGLAGAGPLSFYAMRGLQLGGAVSLPDGVAPRFAYQRFSTGVAAGTEVEVEVDGFSAGLDCEVARLGVTGVQYAAPDVQFNMTFDTPNCSVAMPFSSRKLVVPDNPPGTAGQARYFARLGRGACAGSASPEDQRVVVIFGMAAIDPASVPPDPVAGRRVPINGTIPQSAQLLCKPTQAIISRLNIRANGTALFGLELADPPQNRTLEKVGPWDVAQAMFDSYRNDIAAGMADTTPPFYLPDFVNVDSPMFLALGMRQKATGSATPPSTFLEEPALRSLAEDYFQQHAALLASTAMTEQTTASATGTAVLEDERLIVRFLTVQLMVGLLGVAIILTTVAAFLVPRKGFLPRDPNTIIGTAALISHSRSLLQSLRGAGGGSSAVLRERLGGSSYFTGVEPYEHASSNSIGYFKIFGSPPTQEADTRPVERSESFPFPIALHPVVRIAAFALVVALIISLELTLRISKKNDGLGDAADERSYAHFLWTAVPALVLMLFATYFASADHTIRALAPFAALRRGGTFENSVSLNYLDKYPPAVLYASVKFRNVAVAAATAALLTSSQFVTFTAPAFSVLTVPAVLPVRLLGLDDFASSRSIPDLGSCADCGENGAVVSSLILNANMPYPAFTYEDLNFPTLVLDGALDNAAIPDDAVISASLPAVRPAMSCRMLEQSDIATNLTVGNTLGGKVNPLRIDLSGEQPLGNTDSTASTFILGTAEPLDGVTAISQDAFFGATDHRQIMLDNGTVVSHWVYVWGKLADANTNRTTVKAISAMVCNESLEQIDASVTFFGSSLTILESNPPVVESSAIPVTVAIPTDSANFYSQLANLSTPHILDPFFASLVASRYAIPVSNLGNADRDLAQGVPGAIIKQHKIIRTQVLRDDLTRQSSDPAKLNTNNTTTTFTGTLTSAALDPNLDSSTIAGRLSARRRVVQDPTATRILQALAGATAALALLSWAAAQRADQVHPRASAGSGSIASTAALLADGSNTFGLLGRAAEWQADPARLRALFMDGLHVAMGFRLGWEVAAGRRRGRGRRGEARGKDDGGGREEVFGVGAVRTGGWGGGENIGLGLQARVGFGHRAHVRDWGWRT